MPKISPFSMEKLMFLAASTVPFLWKSFYRGFLPVSSVPFKLFPRSLEISVLQLIHQYSQPYYSAASSVVSVSVSVVTSAVSSLSASASAESSKGITAPSYFSLIKSLISSDFKVSTSALIASLSSFPSLTAITFTLCFLLLQNQMSHKR